MSRTIRSLEDRLSVRLIDRTTRSVSLTEAGRLYLTRCQRVMEEAQQADLALNAFLAEPRGRLRVGVTTAFARSILTSRIAGFLECHPQLAVDLEMPGSGLSDGGVDVTISIEAPGDSNLLIRSLLRVPQGIYASPAYLVRHPAPGSPTELRRHVCIADSWSAASSVEPGGWTTWRLTRRGERAEVRMEARASAADPAVNQQLALAGTGVARLPRPLVKADVEAGQLVRLLPEWEAETVELHAFYPPQLSGSPKLRTLVEFIKGQR